MNMYIKVPSTVTELAFSKASYYSFSTWWYCFCTYSSNMALIQVPVNQFYLATIKYML